MSRLNQQQKGALIKELTSIVGRKNISTKPYDTLQYRKGIRFGLGDAVAALTPGNLIQQWKILKICVKADVIIIMQAANTGLTGGSTPDGDDYDRDIVIINTLKMAKINLINSAKQVVCLPGSTLNQLEIELKKYDREPHSVIGSSCIGASVMGGICNNSGGALVQRGPAYTQMALFAQINSKGEVELVNHLGINLGKEPEEILRRVENNEYSQEDIVQDAGAGYAADYCEHVKKIDADTPSRYNANPKYHYDASGCAGKLMVFAVRLDTFALEKKQQVFYIGSNNIEQLNHIRREALSSFKNLPIAGEYMHRECFALTHIYGKDTFLMVKKLGTANLKKLYAVKDWYERLNYRFPFLPNHLPDRLSQFFFNLFPEHLPKRMLDFHKKYEHHLMLKMGGETIDEARKMLANYFTKSSKEVGDYFECIAEEGSDAFLHRFAAASAANRYAVVHSKKSAGIIALDIALPRNEQNWVEHLPPEIDNKLLQKLYYGHFMCHVFHQDYIAKKGVDCIATEEEMWKILDKRKAEYPAEHNVGHLYHAKPQLKEFYMKLDPTNSFNPGIGRTSKNKEWK